MIRIAVPESMAGTTIPHLVRANRIVFFEPEVRVGTIVNTQDTIVQFRSFDIPHRVLDSFHVGLVGSDCLEERELELGISPEVLSRYKYGRHFFTEPTLDFIARRDSDIVSLSQLGPGRIVITEYPNLTKNHLEGVLGKDGKNLKVALPGVDGAPSKPEDFRRYCKKEGKIGLEIVHGSIAAAVTADGSIGVMVSETNDTVQRYPVRIVENLRQIDTCLIANPVSMRRRIFKREIGELKTDLDLAYTQIMCEKEGRTHPEGIPVSVSGERRL